MAQHVPSRTGQPAEDGQSMVEYGVIVALIAVATMGAVQVFGTELAGVFTRLVGRLTGVG